MIIKFLPDYIFKIFCTSSYTIYNTMKKGFNLLESSLLIKPENLSNFFKVNIFENLQGINQFLLMGNDNSVRMGVSKMVVFSIT